MTFRLAFAAVFVVLLVHGLLLFIDGYGLYTEIDAPMHFLGGFAVAMLGLALYARAHAADPKPFPLWYRYLFVASFALFIGVLWEFHEFIFDRTVNVWLELPRAQVTVADTMQDFLNDWLGATLAFFVFKNKRGSNKRSLKI
ncbi:hypothetical protein HY631_02350 [Candidatus Uhrbacteria bacterium]|nr:hypothetical protein [Candidatus Uhrbacteria bacterium]